MAEECLDLTSDTEADLIVTTHSQAKRPEVVSLLSDSEGDATSPQNVPVSTAGIKRKQPEHSSQQKVSTDQTAAQPNSPIHGQSRQTPALGQPSSSKYAEVPADLSADDEDADLRVPLAFAAKSKQNPLHHASADAAFDDSTFNAAFGNNLTSPFTSSKQAFPSQQMYAPEVASDDDDSKDSVAMDNLGSQPTPAAKPSKKRSRPVGDISVGKGMSKEGKKARAAEEKERKKLEAAAEKERKKVQRENEKAAKESAKAMQKQEKLREKEGNRASKGFYACQEITAVLDTKLATHKTGLSIMDKLQSYTRKAPTPCNGFKVDIQPNPMAPIKSIRWRRASVTQSGADLNGSDAEDVPYVLLYFTAEEFVVEVEKDNFQSMLHRAAEVHPDCTVCLLVDKLEPWLIQQDRKGYPDRIRSERSKTDLFVFDLAVKWPGVRHMLALDQAQAVEHVVTLTYGLGLQPYKAQESWLYSYGGTKETAALRGLMIQHPLEHKERETWMHALVHVDSVAPAAAHVIASTYPSLSILLAACIDPCRDQRDKQGLIEDLPQPTGRGRVGPMAAKKLIGLLTAEDPMTPMDSFK